MVRSERHSTAQCCLALRSAVAQLTHVRRARVPDAAPLPQRETARRATAPVLLTDATQAAAVRASYITSIPCHAAQAASRTACVPRWPVGLVARSIVAGCTSSLATFVPRYSPAQPLSFLFAQRFGGPLLRMDAPIALLVWLACGALAASARSASAATLARLASALASPLLEPALVAVLRSSSRLLESSFSSG